MLGYLLLSLCTFLAAVPRSGLIEASETDYDVMCKGMTAAYEKCKCTTNPTTSVGYVNEQAFVGCIRPEIELYANFSGSDRYLSSLSVRQDGTGMRQVDLTFDANDTVASCDVTSFGRDCQCTVCASATTGKGAGLDIDCNSIPGGGAASTNGTCSRLLDLFQYSFEGTPTPTSAAGGKHLSSLVWKAPVVAFATIAIMVVSS
jgi:hypothetical protein